MAFHHMLRGLLGDDGTVRLHRILVDSLAGERLTIEKVREAAEEVHGAELDWFFEQWLVEGVIPEYRIVEGQVILAENVTTRNLEYTTSVRIANRGTGFMPVPVVLSVEGDSIEQLVELGANEEKVVLFVTRDRPISVAIDPEGWIVQKPEFDDRARKPIHPVLFFKTVKEM